MKKQTKLLGLLAAVLLIAGMVILYSKFSEKTVEGIKEITIEIVDSAEKNVKYELNTDAETLEEAMKECENLTYEGEESTYGLTILTINGETADFNEDGAYWAFYVNGEYCNYGVSEQPVEDGDAFSIVYTVYEE